MSEDNLKRITVIIAGRSYPVKIKPEEESVVRKIEKDVNEKLNDFQLSYQGKDIQDHMSLAMLSYAFEIQKLKSNDELEVLDKKLAEITTLLDIK